MYATRMHLPFPSMYATRIYSPSMYYIWLHDQYFKFISIILKQAVPMFNKDPAS
jgi:hypothetical protein